jgi:hypothetical protein
MTVMDNLHQKGWVRREVEGRAYRYTAVSTRAAYAAALMNEAWSKSDNQAAALVAFFGMMSPEQRRSLEDAVRIVRDDEGDGAAGEEAENSGGPAGPGSGAPAHNGERRTAPAIAGSAEDSLPGPDSERGTEEAGAGHEQTSEGAGDAEHVER